MIHIPGLVEHVCVTRGLDNLHRLELLSLCADYGWRPLPNTHISQRSTSEHSVYKKADRDKLPTWLPVPFRHAYSDKDYGGDFPNWHQDVLNGRHDYWSLLWCDNSPTEIFIPTMGEVVQPGPFQLVGINNGKVIHRCPMFEGQRSMLRIMPMLPPTRLEA